MKKFFLSFLICVFVHVHAMDKKSRSNSCPPAKSAKVQSARKPLLLAPSQPATGPSTQSLTPRSPRYSPEEKEQALEALMNRIEKEQHAYQQGQTLHDNNLLAFLFKLEQQGNKLVEERKRLITEQETLTEKPERVGVLEYLMERGRKNSLSRKKDALDQEIAQNNLERHVLAKKLDTHNKFRSGDGEPSASSSSQK